MKKIYYLIVLSFLFTALQANAQNSNSSGDGFSQLIKSNPADAAKLVQNFAEPLFKGFGIGLNSGWNNTAKTKKLLHFDLRITFNAATVPTSDQSFNVRSIGLSNHVTVDASSPTSIAPTIAGDKNAATPLMDINNDAGTKISSFNMPKGQLPIIPAPNIQLTVGIFKNTDLTIRTIPTITISNDAGSVGMVGFGIKHDLIQDFAKKIPKPFDLAIAVNYNRINYTKTLSVNPDAGSTAAPGSSSDFSNQRLSGHFTGFNVQGIISKKLAFFTPFFAVAYQTADTDMGVLGNYPISASSTTYTTVTDPVHISETSVSGVRMDLGFQLNLGFFRLYAAGSTSNGYLSGNGGFGFGF